MDSIVVGNATVGNDFPLSLIAGPCQIESLGHAEHIAGFLAELASRQGMGFIFKASFDKANRTSLDSARGPGIEKGLKVLSEVRRKRRMPGLDRCPRCRAMPRNSFRRRRASGAGISLPANRLACCRRHDRKAGQFEKRTIPSSLGHAPCCGKG